MSAFDELPPGPVEPLTSKTSKGEPYRRSPWVEREIGQALRLSEAEWIRVLRDLQHETVVHLTRYTDRRGMKAYAELFTELAGRTTQMAGQ